MDTTIGSQLMRFAINREKHRFIRVSTKSRRKWVNASLIKQVLCPNYAEDLKKVE